MTWKDFKEAVERQGARDEDQIAYIDVGSASALAGMKVRITPTPALGGHPAVRVLRIT